MFADGGAVDPDTLALLSLIARCSLEDVENVQGRRKGKDKGGPPTDEELALELYAEEARELSVLAQDMILARSIGEALVADAAYLEEHVRLEETARSDREMARAIAEGRLPTVAAIPAQTAPSVAATQTLTTVATSSGRSSAQAISSSSTKKLPSTAPARRESCVICRDDIQGPTIYAPCGDTYDVQCLVDLFRSATVDESLFPPACCRQPFDLAKVKMYFTKDLVALFEKKAIEFGTKNRVYCHRPACSAFLSAATPFASRLTCLECRADTCGHCKNVAHSLFIRCTNAEDAGVVALAEQAGWKRCPGCGHLVELTIGCYHMTCRCRHQFCYLCAATWKTCTCAQWDENRLLNAAQDRVQRQQQLQGAGNAGGAARIVEFRQGVAREVERLRQNHDCTHRWRYVSGGGNCEGCGQYLRLFLFHCGDCYARTCARCRRNRWLW